MEMTAARMRADAADLDDVALGVLWCKVKRIVNDLTDDPVRRREKGPEFHATAVLHLGIIEEEMCRRGEENLRVITGRTQSRFSQAMKPSAN